MPTKPGGGAVCVAGAVLVGLGCRSAYMASGSEPSTLCLLMLACVAGACLCARLCCFAWHAYLLSLTQLTLTNLDTIALPQSACTHYLLHTDAHSFSLPTYTYLLSLTQLILTDFQPFAVSLTQLTPNLQNLGMWCYPVLQCCFLSS